MLPFGVPAVAGSPLVVFCAWQPTAFLIELTIGWAAFTAGLWLFSLFLYLRWVPLVKR
jgi:hypothetical protein